MHAIKYVNPEGKQWSEFLYKYTNNWSIYIFTLFSSNTAFAILVSCKVWPRERDNKLVMSYTNNNKGKTKLATNLVVLMQSNAVNYYANGKIPKIIKFRQLISCPYVDFVLTDMQNF